MKQLNELISNVLMYSEERNTRSGRVHGIFGANMEFDLRKGFPAVTAKKLMFKAMAGELLWFLNGSTDLDSLRYFSDLDKDAWTIWTNDCNRWHQQPRFSTTGAELTNLNDLGELYGAQWRTYDGEFIQVDQIQKLLTGLKEDPFSRYHIVNSWNVEAIERGLMALPPCHVLFQCYVSADGHLDLMWYQRSVDVFLGRMYA